jgi:hypothetical protein
MPVNTLVELPNLNIENTTKLRDFIATLPEDTFNHSEWFDSDTDRVAEVQVGDRHICGTAACIGGWATIMFNPEACHFDGDFCIGIDYPSVHTMDALGIDGIYTFEVLMSPWNYDGYDLALLFAIENTYENIAELSEVSLSTYSDTTNKEAAAFLTRMIEQKAIDIRWWAEIRKELADA